METRKTHTVFIVENDRQTIAQFRDFFKDLPYLVYYCATPDEAMSIITGVAPDIVLCRLASEHPERQSFFQSFQEKSPNSIRIVYSNENDMSELMKFVASGLAQRLLCFPWEKHRVAETLSRDLLTRSRIRLRKCWDFLQNENIITPLPKVLKKIESLLASPEYNLQDIAELIEHDPFIVSCILKVVNSPAFIKRSTITTISNAVSFLGVRQIREILYFLCAMKYLPTPKPCHGYATKLANRSFFCSRIAGEIAKDVAPYVKTEATTAALLHDIGKLLLFSVACDQFLDYVKTNEMCCCLPLDVEEKLFGVNHSELGSCLLVWWNLPMSIVEAAANHHLPLQELWTLPMCVAIADRIIDEFRGDKSHTDELNSLSPVYNVDRWREQVVSIAKDMENLF